MRFFLPDSAATRKFAQNIARILTKNEYLPILLQGDLGTGKTSFVRSFVQSFPGGDRSEISSPSFNIFNIYPTSPEIIHFDLYRHLDMVTAEDLAQYLAEPEFLVLIEWADNLPSGYRPQKYLQLVFDFQESGRRVVLSSYPDEYMHMFNRLDKELSG